MTSTEIRVQRVAQEIADLKANPIPNVHVFPSAEDDMRLCLVLDLKSHSRPLHINVEFTEQFPCVPPKVILES